ncbi:Wzz/FepE/Etk N-terminal domain-containing protein [Vibrio sp. 299]|uniref:Wzz/FepE/Etk N-terminal domain-containing protein n=1 Tax=Vibrio TaxID=662 RepID=UPI0029656076|nr:Wzz/FepE/Etk N-terminal domain-containing protein [Vibrio sp. 299]MDW1996608.1 Wzz/FepE/Etk N-terminal domain-containing protein [Vibrio sp. 299]
MEPQKEPHPKYLPHSIQSKSHDDEMELREIFKAIWKGKWVIIVTTVIFAIGSVSYALSLPNVYKADATLAPAETSSGSSLSKMAGQFGGIAALAGVNLSSNSVSQTDLAVEVMKSRHFVESFIERHSIMVSLMAVKDWDLAKNQLIYDEDIYNPSTGTWLRKPQGLRGAKPSPQEAFEVFNKEVLSITEDKDSGLYKISIRHYSPYVAKEWVDWLIQDINNVMRDRAVAEASKNLTFLKKQLSKTAITDMQSTFYKLIEEQTKSLMLAEAQEEYIFKVIDPSITPEIKSSPNRPLICILSVFLGGMLGVSIVIIRFAFQRRKL